MNLSAPLLHFRSKILSRETKFPSQLTTPQAVRVAPFSEDIQPRIRLSSPLLRLSVSHHSQRTFNHVSVSSYNTLGCLCCTLPKAHRTKDPSQVTTSWAVCISPLQTDLEPHIHICLPFHRLAMSDPSQRTLNHISISANFSTDSQCMTLPKGH